MKFNEQVLEKNSNIIKSYTSSSINIHDKNFYFMHSYCVKDFDKNECIYYSNYSNEQIPSIFKKNNSYAFQFHLKAM